MKPPFRFGLWLLVVSGAFAGGVWFQRYQLGQTIHAPGSIPAFAGNALHGHTSPSRPSAPSIPALDSVQGFLQNYHDTPGPLSPERMRDAVIEVVQESDPVKGSLMFSLILDKISPQNAPEAMAEIRTRLSGVEASRYAGLLSFKWATLDGPACLKEAQKMDGSARMLATSSGLAGWALQDPAAAQAWLKSQPDSTEMDSFAMARGLTSGLARADAEAAISWVKDLKDDVSRQRLAQVIAGEKIKQDLNKAAQWAVELKDPQMRTGAFESVVDQLYANDPKLAAAFVTEHGGEEFTSGAAATLARRLTATDPQQGLRFARGLPSGFSRQEAFSNAFEEWAAHDPTAASTALQSLTPGPDRDAAIPGLATSVAKDEPEAALIWAEHISDAELRQHTLVDTLRLHYRKDPDGALAYMNTHGWTVEQQLTVKIEKEEDAMRAFIRGYRSRLAR